MRVIYPPPGYEGIILVPENPKPPFGGILKLKPMPEGEPVPVRECEEE